MVAGGTGDDAARAGRLVQLQHGVQGPAHLERARAIVVLQLQPDLLAQARRRFQRSGPQPWRQVCARAGHIRQLQHVSSFSARARARARVDRAQW